MDRTLSQVSYAETHKLATTKLASCTLTPIWGDNTTCVFPHSQSPKFSSIVWGCKNLNIAHYSTIVAGVSNCITTSTAYGSDISGLEFAACHNSILNGFNNKISVAHGSSILGGCANSISYSCDSSIAGGRCNYLGVGTSYTSSCFSFIGGGFKNTIIGGTYSSDFAVLGGGCNNTIRGGIGSTLAGGRNNLITGPNSSILGGSENQVTGNYDTVVAGAGNVSLAAPAPGSYIFIKDDNLSIHPDYVLQSLTTLNSYYQQYLIAPGANINTLTATGAIFKYSKLSSETTDRTLYATLTSPNAKSYGFFGSSYFYTRYITPQYQFIGAPGESAVYIYRDDSLGNSTLVQTISAPALDVNYLSSGEFGFSVWLNYYNNNDWQTNSVFNLLLIGAPGVNKVYMLSAEKDWFLNPSSSMFKYCNTIVSHVSGISARPDARFGHSIVGNQLQDPKNTHGTLSAYGIFVGAPGAVTEAFIGTPYNVSLSARTGSIAFFALSANPTTYKANYSSIRDYGDYFDKTYPLYHNRQGDRVGEVLHLCSMRADQDQWPINDLNGPVFYVYFDVKNANLFQYSQFVDNDDKVLSIRFRREDASTNEVFTPTTTTNSTLSTIVLSAGITYGGRYYTRTGLNQSYGTFNQLGQGGTSVVLRDKPSFNINLLTNSNGWNSLRQNDGTNGNRTNASLSDRNANSLFPSYSATTTSLSSNPGALWTAGNDGGDYTLTFYSYPNNDLAKIRAFGFTSFRSGRNDIYKNIPGTTIYFLSSFNGQAPFRLMRAEYSFEAIRDVTTANYVGGGFYNNIAGRRSVIVGGTRNSIGAYNCDSLIGGGQSNIIYGGNTSCFYINNTIVNATNSNIAYSNFSLIGAGNYSCIVNSNYSFIGGGNQNKIAIDNVTTDSYSTIGGGSGNAICNTCCSTIAGGVNNRICSQNSSILGGRNNTIPSSLTNSHIIGSDITALRSNTTYTNTICSNGGLGVLGDAFIGGKLFVTSLSALSANIANVDVAVIESLTAIDINGYIKTGEYLQATQHLKSRSIVAGTNSTGPQTYYYSSILGGNNNTINSDFVNILGGNSNLINSSSNYSIILGGCNNTINGNVSGSLIGLGCSNTMDGGVNGSVILYGNSNCVRVPVLGVNKSSIVIGNNNDLQNTNVVLYGNSNVICSNSYDNIILGNNNTAKFGASANYVLGNFNTLSSVDNKNFYVGNSNCTYGSCCSYILGNNSRIGYSTNSFILGNDSTILNATCSYLLASSALLTMSNTLYTPNISSNNLYTGVISSIKIENTDYINTDKLSANFAHFDNVNFDLITINSGLTVNDSITADNIVLTTGDIRTFNSAVTASGDFIVLNINNKLRALRLWDFE